MTSTTKYSVVILLLSLSLFGACKSPEALPADQLSLGVNKSARVGANISVRVDTISDGRCPVPLQCLVAGDAFVSLSVSNGTETQKRRLSLYRSVSVRTDSTTAQLGSSLYSIVLRNVVPYPDITKPRVEPEAIIQVSKL